MWSRKDPALTAEELRQFCRENLTGYKVPRRIEFRETLPKTNVGKVLRRALQGRGARHAFVSRSLSHAKKKPGRRPG